MINEILNKAYLDRNDILFLLNTDKEDAAELYKKAADVKLSTVGNRVYFRGLIEFSNICDKDCFYCGIRKSNKNFSRYNLTDEQILEAAEFALKENYASLAIQSGELRSPAFTLRIEKLLQKINKMSGGKLGITISLGEQDKETYQRWFDAGAHRYLLRIESSKSDLYYKLHPHNNLHKHSDRLSCLNDLRELGYQVGTGVMIGAPYQSLDNLADDLIFLRDFDIDMCGMGPYIEHEDTPLYSHRNELLTKRERFVLSLKMIAILRIIMPDINIAAATALQAIDPIGREKALKVGANIMMPNITPGMYRNDYSLYEEKPCTDEEASDCKNCMEMRIQMAGDTIGYGEWGDSLRFRKRIAK
ncbi:MAG: [FeFe] hydrogenase H-cluster radical SAM maturase HydE [Bacteroidales bacterium]|nr:[FeFe] hydrogenase H-cluster radical SAM maturase HydE [Bacteroidales bacterium]